MIRHHYIFFGSFRSNQVANYVSTFVLLSLFQIFFDSILCSQITTSRFDILGFSFEFCWWPAATYGIGK